MVDATTGIIICLMGPTATGKTELAIALCRQFPCEIVSVDSALVYCGLDIGTAKPTFAHRQAVPHHLIDVCDPACPYSAGRFRREATVVIQQVLDRGNVPLLVGGTMLYFHLLQQGINDLPTADPQLRQALLAQASQLGWPALHQRLRVIDPATAAKLHPNDSQRIQRALEVYQLSGKTMTDYQSLPTRPALPYRMVNIILDVADRQRLHRRIADRFSSMLERGFVDEVAHLKQRVDLHLQLPSIRTVGYRQVWCYLAGDYDQQTMRQRAIIATRQLAKRQITWLKRWQDATRYCYDDPQLLAKVSRQLQQELYVER